jgi:DNA-binding SARP family transcriptional activator/tetratricopeptide (TPR) repeat protein/TolB-like protein
MLELQTLGTLSCRNADSGQELHSLVAQPKRVSLLVYLALARPRGFQRRDTLLGLFWPESSETRARAALSQAVYTLRRMLGDSIVVTRGDEDLAIGDGQVLCDAIAFEEALAAGERERALELYGGEFLKGFYLSECIEFERWVHGERSRLHRSAVDAAWTLADEQGAAGNPVAATHWARRAVGLAPDDEPSIRRLMTLLAFAGDRAGALREYEAFARRMTELELDVAEATRVLVERIRGGEVARAHTNTVATAAGGPDAPPASPVSHTSGASQGPANPAGGPSSPKSSDARPRVRRSLAVAVAAAIALVAFAAGASAWRARAAERPLYDEKRVLVAELTNETGDPALSTLGRVAADWIAQGLNHTGLVEVVPAVTAMRYAQGLDVALEAPPAVVNRMLAEETGAGILVSGSYYREGDSLIIQARITDARSGRLHRGIEPIRGPAREPMAAVEQLRQRTIGALASLIDPRLALWSSSASQPPSYQAYQLYADGLDEFFRVEPESFRRAAVLFREAASLDSGFTAPLIWATFAHMNVDEFAAADSLARTLELSRATLPAWDRAVLAYQQASIRGDIASAYNAAQRVVDLAPQSEWRFLLAQSAIGVNRPREALRVLRAVDPDRGWIRSWPAYWIVLSTGEHFSGEYAAELATLRRGRVRHPQQRMLSVFQLRALGATGDLEQGLAFADSLAASRSDAMLPLDAYLMLARELRTHGRARDAVRAAERGLTVASVTGVPGFQRARYVHALLLMEAERWDDVYTVAAGLPQPGPGGANAGVLGVAAVRLGRHAEVELALQALQRTSEQPADRLSYGSAKLWAAAIHAHRGELETAVELVRLAIAEGASVTGRGIHGHQGLAPLRGYPAFEALIRPRG